MHAGYLHGACALFVLALAMVNFGVAQAVAGQPYGCVHAGVPWPASRSCQPHRHVRQWKAVAQRAPALVADACGVKMPQMLCAPCRAPVIWALNAGLLLAARLGNGFRFATLGPLLAPLDNHRWGGGAACCRLPPPAAAAAAAAAGVVMTW